MEKYTDVYGGRVETCAFCGIKVDARGFRNDDEGGFSDFGKLFEEFGLSGG